MDGDDDELVSDGDGCMDGDDDDGWIVMMMMDGW